MLNSPPLTARKLAELMYQSYLLHSLGYDPNLHPFARLQWERMPAYTKELLYDVATDIIEELNRR